MINDKLALAMVDSIEDHPEGGDQKLTNEIRKWLEAHTGKYQTPQFKVDLDLKKH